MRKSKADWIVVGGATGEVGYCQRCGIGLSLPMPIDMNVFIGAIDGFTKTHKNCQDTGYKPPEINRHNWIASRDTGISSKTIWSVMTGNTVEDHYPPSDPADFGRCYRLLKLFPEWVPKLHRVSEKYPSWSGLVAHWGELTALYEEELPTGWSEKLFARMKELLKD